MMTENKVYVVCYWDNTMVEPYVKAFDNKANAQLCYEQYSKSYRTSITEVPGESRFD